MIKESENNEEKISPSQDGVRSELRQQTANYILAALGLVAGLAWNDAIKTFIETVFTVSKDSVFAKFIYAGLITIVIVTASYYIGHWARNKK